MENNVCYNNFLIVRVNESGLQYDINAIIKAFYPDKEIRVIEPGIPVHDERLLTLPVYMEIRIPGYINILGNTYNYVTDESIGAKNSLKTALYDLMCKITGKTLPWGNLTGVRPVKIAMTHLAQGQTDEQIMDFMTGYHRVSQKKASLAVDIAHREKALLDRLRSHDGYSLYIGIPFCPTTCLYCSFTSFAYAAWKNRIDKYLECLYREIDHIAHVSAKPDLPQERTGSVPVKSGHGNGMIHGIPDTIYIGGGTPTSLDEEHLEKLLRYLTDRIDVSKCLEFTCEAGRPDSITQSKLDIMKKYGVTRISINPQTMQQKTLDIIGRRTTPEQVKEAFAMARKAGFDNINMDIILGLPGEGIPEVSDTLEQIRALAPDSLTVHSLAIKRASALKQHLDEIGIDALNNTEETMSLASQAAYDMSMKPYYLYRQKNMSGNFENTGFATPGKEGIYNVLIMEEVQSIVAIGAGAISKRVDYEAGEDAGVLITRCENPKDVDNYILRIDEMIERKIRLYNTQTDT